MRSDSLALLQERTQARRGCGGQGVCQQQQSSPAEHLPKRFRQVQPAEEPGTDAGCETWQRQLSMSDPVMQSRLGLRRLVSVALVHGNAMESSQAGLGGCDRVR